MMIAKKPTKCQGKLNQGTQPAEYILETSSKTPLSDMANEEDDIEKGAVHLGQGLDDETHTTAADYGVTKENAAKEIAYNGVVHSNTSLSSRTLCNVGLVLLVGACAGITILALGITASKRDLETRFVLQAEDLVNQFERALRDYVAAGLWVHQACRSRTISHSDFRGVYEYLLSSGLEFQLVGFAMNVSSAERLTLENETHAYLGYAHPDIDYIGFKEFNPPPKFCSVPANRSSHFPVHFAEPLDQRKTQSLLDYDISHSSQLMDPINEALRTGTPTITKRLKSKGDGYHVRLMHPGIQLSNEKDFKLNSVAFMTIRFPVLLERTHDSMRLGETMSVYIYDSSDQLENDVFLGGATLPTADNLIFTNETELEDLRAIGFHYNLERQFPVASRQYRAVVVAPKESFESEIGFVILAATMIFVACACLAAWIYTNARREKRLGLLKAKIIFEHARQAANAERELNDYIAHEVRNPLSVCISAISFVSSAVNEAQPLVDAESQLSVREDINIIESGLHFINDLLRTMLDMNRAANKQLKIELSNVDLLRDVLEPVESMLYNRGENFEVLVECPPNLLVMTDRIRLKQTMLNLGRNSSKFVREGFVRLRADIVNGNVCLFVEDSGPGIPQEKRGKIFAKYQESLDSLSQGTGIGLSLCKSLVELMGGDISLDESYDSGVKGWPGARFVIHLNRPPLCIANFEESFLSSSIEDEDVENEAVANQTASVDCEGSDELPPNLTVLVVDDDPIIRKLFSRALGRVGVDWKIHEAASGETALHIVESIRFDLIFMDHYMASVEKQLLGPEAVRALRVKGVKSVICGLSGSDAGKAFIKAGADHFMLKPPPCGKVALREALLQMLRQPSNLTPPMGIVESSPSRVVPDEEQELVLVKQKSSATGCNDVPLELPAKLSVLFVDDDAIIRKLFGRALRRVAAGWDVQEAANGEAALRLAESTSFDLIFMDQYMMVASGVEKSLLGTETVRALRAKGVTSTICGLSANQLEESFLLAGADAFMLKPPPSEKGALLLALSRLLRSSSVRVENGCELANFEDNHQPNKPIPVNEPHSDQVSQNE